MTAELSMSKSVNQIDQGRLFLELVFFYLKQQSLPSKLAISSPQFSFLVLSK
jgi:hypothetical protein